jgi:hypothetical protein
VSGEQQQHEQSERGISIAIWTTARGRALHRVRVTDEADPDAIELVIGRALAAHRRLEAELSGQTPGVRGEEPRVAA